MLRYVENAHCQGVGGAVEVLSCEGSGKYLATSLSRSWCWPPHTHSLPLASAHVLGSLAREVPFEDDPKKAFSRVTRQAP